MDSRTVRIGFGFFFPFPFPHLSAALYGRKSLSRWNSMLLRHKSVHSSKKTARQWISPVIMGILGGHKPTNIDPISYYSHTDSVADLQQSRGKTQIWEALMYRRHMYFQRFLL